MKMFLIKDWECKTVWLSGYWEYSGKSVCIKNNNIKEIFTVLLTTNLRLSRV